MLEIKTSRSSFTYDDTHLMALLKIQTEMLKSIHDFLYEKKLVQLMPVILSPMTDPLNHSVYDASVTYGDQKFQLTKSMIFHKQLAIGATSGPGIYIMSPNVRLEKETMQQSGRHLFEFSQVDIELRGASTQDFMDFMEDLIIATLIHIKQKCSEEVAIFESRLEIPSKPFRIYNSFNLREQLGEDFEQIMSSTSTDFFWIMDYTREFYDKEDPEHKGHYINYDLFYPYGFNEALSGGERDYEYKILLRKIKERNQDPQTFDFYLKAAKEGKLTSSAGGGLGLERFLRYILKQSNIGDICLFPKIPGQKVQI
ncbi:asparagine synthetase A [Candidatus Lokiarchaeum ossiferum]|uniref:asparagine synthetase A n=1 Tax=Candidatus Lokiarchaeum ossiferum TaxID=2951803 RepID=UPI00352FD261